MSIERKPSKLEQKIILTPLKKYIERTFNVEVLRNDTIGLKPPYIIVSNHVTNWDPFFINCYVEEPICFVAAASNYQKPIMEKILNYAGAISKTKSQADSSTIRKIFKAIKYNRVVGIFPEGNRNWNGQMEPIVFSTSKLIKSLRVPVIVVNIKGGYLSHPRWADSVRKGKVTVEFKKVWDAEQLKTQSVEALHARLSAELFVDDLTWQEQTGIEFNGKNLANYLERYLFACPSCREIGHMESTQDIFGCTKCHYQVRYTNKGTFEEVNQPIKFTHVFDWNEWQVNHLDQCMSQSLFTTSIEHFLDEVVIVSKMKVNGEYQALGEFRMVVQNSVLTFSSTKNDSIEFELLITHVEGLNIFKQKIINFLYKGEQYHLDFKNKRAATFMLKTYIDLAKK